MTKKSRKKALTQVETTILPHDAELAQIEDAEMLGWEQNCMNTLEEALRMGEEPPRSRVMQILMLTYGVEIPLLVRKYIIRCLNQNDDKKRGKVGKQSSSLLDAYFTRAEDVFGFVIDQGEFKTRHEFLRHEYDRLRSAGYKQADAIKKIGEEYAHLFKSGNESPSFDTVYKEIYKKKK